MNGADGPGPGDDGGPDLPETIHVPDDPSELAADVLALRRERAAARRRERLARLTGTQRLRAYGISLPVLLAVVAVVGGLGALLILLGPRTRTVTPSPRLTASPTAAPGRAGGRLPATELRQPDGASVAAATLTAPAVLLLVPAGCDCDATVDTAVTLTLRGRVKTYVVEPTTAEAATLNGRGSTLLSAYTDPADALLETYGSTARAPTLLLLDSDGAVRTVTTGLTELTVPAALADLPG